MYFLYQKSYCCCGASVAREKQHNQELRRINKMEYEFSNLSLFSQNALHLKRVHSATFYQSALRHELHEDVTPSSRVDSSKKGLMVVMFCSDLPVKRCEDRT